MRDGISHGAIIAMRNVQKSAARSSRTAAGRDEKLKVEIFRPVKPDSGGKGRKADKQNPPNDVLHRPDRPDCGRGSMHLEEYAAAILPKGKNSARQLSGRRKEGAHIK